METSPVASTPSSRLPLPTSSPTGPKDISGGVFSLLVVAAGPPGVPMDVSRTPSATPARADALSAPLPVAPTSVPVVAASVPSAPPARADELSASMPVVPASVPVVPAEGLVPTPAISGMRLSRQAAATGQIDVATPSTSSSPLSEGPSAPPAEASRAGAEQAATPLARLPVPDAGGWSAGASREPGVGVDTLRPNTARPVLDERASASPDASSGGSSAIVSREPGVGADTLRPNTTRPVLDEPVFAPPDAGYGERAQMSPPVALPPGSGPVAASEPSPDIVHPAGRPVAISAGPTRQPEDDAQAVTAASSPPATVAGPVVDGLAPELSPVVPGGPLRTLGNAGADQAQPRAEDDPDEAAAPPPASVPAIAVLPPAIPTVAASAATLVAAASAEARPSPRSEPVGVAGGPTARSGPPAAVAEPGEAPALAAPPPAPADASFAKALGAAEGWIDPAKAAEGRPPEAGAPTASATHGLAPAAAAAAPTLSAPLHAAASPHPLISGVPVAAVPVEIGLRSLAGTNRFDIRLDPDDLGQIDVRLDISAEGQVRAHILVERPEALASLQRETAQLERALEQAGFKTGDDGVSMSLRQQAGGETGRGREDGRDGAPRAPAGQQDVRDGSAEPAPVMRRYAWRSAAGVDRHI